MTVVLNLGVTDMPYSHSANLGKVRRGKTKGQRRVSTVGQVAQILEARYGIMYHFWRVKQERIVGRAMAEALTGSFESMLMGAPAPPGLFDSAMGEIQAMFSDFLSRREIETLRIPGVPTQAALMGVSHRFKQKRGSRRPSFVDTGLYENSFRAWVS